MIKINNKDINYFNFIYDFDRCLHEHLFYISHYIMKTLHIIFINFSMLLPILFIFKGCIINFISDVNRINHNFLSC